MKNLILLPLLLFLVACNSESKSKGVALPMMSEKIASPSKKHSISTIVHKRENSNKNHGEVDIHLFDSTGNLKFIMNTNAGEIGEWAVGWDNTCDTIILTATDIGTYAWRIEQDSMKLIDLNDKITQEAKELKLKKYPNSQ